MEFKEFGKQNQKKALLIHGGYTSWRSLRVQIQELEADYHVFVPLLNGHNINDNSELESIELEASQILEYFMDRSIAMVDIIYGASLGADVSLEILCQANDFAKYAFIESGSLGLNKLAGWILINISKFIIYNGCRGNKVCERVLDSFLSNMKMPKDLCLETKNLLQHMSKRTTKNVQKLVCNYSLKESIRNIKTKCLIVYSSKELMYMKKPYNKMKKMVDDMQIICINDFYHGELCIGEPKKQVSMLKNFILSSQNKPNESCDSVVKQKII